MVVKLYKERFLVFISPSKEHMMKKRVSNIYLEQCLIELSLTGMVYLIVLKNALVVKQPPNKGMDQQFQNKRGGGQHKPLLWRNGKIIYNRKLC